MIAREFDRASAQLSVSIKSYQTNFENLREETGFEVSSSMITHFSIIFLRLEGPDLV